MAWAKTQGCLGGGMSIFLRGSWVWGEGGGSGLGTPTVGISLLNLLILTSDMSPLPEPPLPHLYLSPGDSESRMSTGSKSPRRVSWVGGLSFMAGPCFPRHRASLLRSLNLSTPDGGEGSTLLPAFQLCSTFPDPALVEGFRLDNRENFRKMPLVSGQASQVSLDPAVRQETR